MPAPPPINWEVGGGRRGNRGGHCRPGGLGGQGGNRGGHSLPPPPDKLGGRGAATAIAAVTAAPVVGGAAAAIAAFTQCRPPPPDKLGGRGGRRGNRGGHCCPGGRGAATAIAAVTHCRHPDKLGGEEGLRFWRRAWCRNIQYGGPCEGGSANFQRRGARVSHPWVHGGQAGGVQPGAGPS